MYFDELIQRSYLKVDTPTEDEIVLLPSGCRPHIDSNLVVAKSDFEEILMNNRASDPTSEAVLMTIGRSGITLGDPLWDMMLQRESVMDRFNKLCNDAAVTKLSQFDSTPSSEHVDTVPEEHTLVGVADDGSGFGFPSADSIATDSVCVMGDTSSFIGDDTVSILALPEEEDVSVDTAGDSDGFDGLSAGDEFSIPAGDSSSVTDEGVDIPVTPDDANPVSVDMSITPEDGSPAGVVVAVDEVSEDTVANEYGIPAGEDGMGAYIDTSLRHNKYRPDIERTEVVDDAPSPGFSEDTNDFVEHGVSATSSFEATENSAFSMPTEGVDDAEGPVFGVPVDDAESAVFGVPTDSVGVGDDIDETNGMEEMSMPASTQMPEAPSTVFQFDGINSVPLSSGVGVFPPPPTYSSPMDESPVGGHDPSFGEYLNAIHESVQEVNEREGVEDYGPDDDTTEEQDVVDAHAVETEPTTPTVEENPFANFRGTDTYDVSGYAAPAAAVSVAENDAPVFDMPVNGNSEEPDFSDDTSDVTEDAELPELLESVRVVFQLFHDLVKQHTLPIILNTEGFTPETFCDSIVSEFPQFADQMESSMRTHAGDYNRIVLDLVQSLKLEAESALYAGDPDLAERCIEPVCRLIYS